MILGQTTRKNFTQNPKNDILSGLTVALALVPEAVAFAFVAGVDPLVGLYGAFMMGIVTALFGGRPGMISGATGAMAVVMVHLIQKGNEVGLTLESPIENLGLQWLFITLLFVGAIQIAAGVFRLGKFVRLIPHPVMMGFVNGLAIVIFLSQLGLFPNAVPKEISFLDNTSEWFNAVFSNIPFWKMMGFIGLTMGIMYGLPKLTKKIPAALIAIIVVACITIFGNIEMSTVGSFIREGGGEGLQGTLPTFQDQIFGLFGTLSGHWDTIISTAFILAAVGLIESLMTLNLVDEITETRGSGNRECVAQGGANILNGLFGGMGGCAMIGQSLINVNSGGRGRMSGITSALLLFVFIIFLQPLILMIPMAALVGVMFMVVIGTFEWSTLYTWRKIPISDVLVMILVAGYTVIFHNLAMAVLLGVIVQALVFAWKHATHIFADKKMNEFGSRIYQLHGPLFFASSSSFINLFDAEKDPTDVVIDFYYTRVYDQSGLEAIGRIADRYRNMGKRLHLRHLSNECKDLLDKAEDMVEVNFSEDPNYHVASDRLG